MAEHGISFWKSVSVKICSMRLTLLPIPISFAKKGSHHYDGGKHSGSGGTGVDKNRPCRNNFEIFFKWA